MRGLWLVARRELGAYVNSSWGYLVVAAVLLIDGLLFNAFAMSEKPKLSAQVLQDFFQFSFGTTVIAAILLTMRLVAEERQTGTIVLVDSCPLSAWEIVAGKYLSALIVLLALTAATIYMPALIFVHGKVSAGHVAAGYLGLALVAAAAAAIGTLASALSRTQMVAGVGAAAMVVFLLVAWKLARVSEAPLSDVLSHMSLYDHHFRPFKDGRIAIESVAYYLSIAFVALLGATQVLAARRWR